MLFNISGAREFASLNEEDMKNVKEKMNSFIPGGGEIMEKMAIIFTGVYQVHWMIAEKSWEAVLDNILVNRDPNKGTEEIIMEEVQKFRDDAKIPSGKTLEDFPNHKSHDFENAIEVYAKYFEGCLRAFIPIADTMMELILKLGDLSMGSPLAQMAAMKEGMK